jgi:hypothetical protein
METFEFWKNHRHIAHDYFCRAYSKHHRCKHHYTFLACLFQIEKIQFVDGCSSNEAKG